MYWVVQNLLSRKEDRFKEKQTLGLDPGLNKDSTEVYKKYYRNGFQGQNWSKISRSGSTGKWGWIGNVMAKRLKIQIEVLPGFTPKVTLLINLVKFDWCNKWELCSVNGWLSDKLTIFFSPKLKHICTLITPSTPIPTQSQCDWRHKAVFAFQVWRHPRLIGVPGEVSRF